MSAVCVFVSCVYHGTHSYCFPIPDRISLAEKGRVYCAVRKESGYIIKVYASTEIGELRLTARLITSPVVDTV